MKQQAVGNNNTVTLRLEKTMKRFILVLPLFALFYGLLIANGWAKGSEVFSVYAFAFITAVLGILAVSQMALRSTSTKIRVFYLISYHIMLAIALLFVFGVVSPLTISWLLLIIVTMTFFGRSWALLSFMTLLGVMALNALTIEPQTSSALAQHTLAAVFIGAIAMIFASLRTLEFSEQEKLAESKAKQVDQREALLTIINGTTQAIFTVSTGGIIRIYNAALLSLIDTNESLSGRKVDDVLSLHDVKGEPVSLHKLMKQSPRFERDDLIMRFADGDEIRLHLSVNKVQSAFSSRHRNDGEGFVCIARDVTKAKSLEEERDEFISVVSHELRTPVAITEGTISNVQYFLEHGADAKKLAPALSEAHDQVMLLANMINDLGTLSRAERGVGDNAEDINVRELAEELYKKYTASATKKGLVLNLDLSGRLGNVTTSRLYLEETLQNLITNAIKYTTTGTVTLQVQSTKAGIQFTVKDSGIGISKADLKHIFEKFYRSEDYRTRETSGTGLGLYVVAKLMHKLGSQVEVRSRLNHGSEFSFTLPESTLEPNA